MAVLILADLSWANLSGADLSGADLSRADLSLANLSEADLSGAKYAHLARHLDQDWLKKGGYMIDEEGTIRKKEEPPEEAK